MLNPYDKATICQFITEECAICTSVFTTEDDFSVLCNLWLGPSNQSINSFQVVSKLLVRNESFWLFFLYDTSIYCFFGKSIPIMNFFISLYGYLKVAKAVMTATLTIFMSILFSLCSLVGRDLNAPNSLYGLATVYFSSQPAIPLLYYDKSNRKSF